MAKKTLDELNEQIKAQEKRMRRMRDERKKLLDAEKAKTNVEILDAVREWNESLPEPRKWEELPGYFRRQKTINESRNNQPQYESIHTSSAY